MSRYSFSVAGICLLVVAFAQSTAAQDVDPYVIPQPATLLPWPANNSTRAFQGGSSVAELNLARITFGPCVFRTMHFHIADEVFTVVSGYLQSIMVAPNNTLIAHNLTKHGNVVYPRGWMHYQYNPRCNPAEVLIFFNLAKIGSVQVPQALASAPNNYLAATYNVTAVPSPLAVWVHDAECLKRCKRT